MWFERPLVRNLARFRFGGRAARARRDARSFAFFYSGSSLFVHLAARRTTALTQAHLALDSPSAPRSSVSTYAAHRKRSSVREVDLYRSVQSSAGFLGSPAAESISQTKLKRADSANKRPSIFSLGSVSSTSKVSPPRSQRRPTY